MKITYTSIFVAILFVVMVAMIITLSVLSAKEDFYIEANMIRGGAYEDGAAPLELGETKEYLYMGGDVQDDSYVKCDTYESGVPCTLIRNSS